MILVTDAKYRMTVTLVETLGLEGFELTLSYRSDETEEPIAAYSKYVAKKLCIRCKDDEEYGKKLLEYAKSEYEKNKVKLTILAVSATTIAILSEHRAEFEKYANFLVPTAEVLKTANDKAEVAKLANSLGIKIPREFVKVEQESTEDFLKSVPMPCVIKPHCGEQHHLKAQDRYVIADCYEELNKGYLRFSALGEAPIVQEYVQGVGVGVSVVMDKNGEPVSVFCHRRVREYPISGGPSTCCISFYDQKLAECTVKLLKALHYEGIAMVEYKENNNKFTLLEINPRVWGTFPLTVKSNSSFARKWLEASENRAEGMSVDYIRGKKMQFIASDCLAMAALLKMGRINKAFSVIFDFLNPKVSEGVFDKKDMKPFFLYILGLLKR